MSRNVRALRENGVGFLCEFLKAAMRTADAAGTAVTRLSCATNQAVMELMGRIDACRPFSISFSLAPGEWKQNTEAETLSVCPYCYDLEIEGVTEADLAVIADSPISTSAVAVCIHACRTTEGLVRFYAKAVPTGVISGDGWIFKGVGTEEEKEQEGGET